MNTNQTPLRVPLAAIVLFALATCCGMQLAADMDILDTNTKLARCRDESRDGGFAVYEACKARILRE